MKNPSSNNIDAHVSPIFPSFNMPERLRVKIKLGIGDSVVKQLETCNWKEIRLEHCFDGSFGYRPDCQAWMRQFASYVIEKLGTTPMIRIYAYSSGGDTLLAVDAFSSKSSEYVALTALVTEKYTYLSGPAGNQFDIALPGIIDGLSLVDSLLSFTQGILKSGQELWACQTDRQDASQHAPRS